MPEDEKKVYLNNTHEAGAIQVTRKELMVWLHELADRPGVAVQISFERVGQYERLTAEVRTDAD